MLPLSILGVLGKISRNYSIHSEMASIKDLLIQQFRIRVFEESVPRIKKCLAELSDEEIWWRPNENSNAIGNLVLHLCGNARQWILSGIGGAPDMRERQKEFDQRDIIPKADLLQLLDNLILEITDLLPKITTKELLRVRPVQIYQDTAVSILIHVIEHFSYHVGQMTVIVKLLKNKQLGYYGGQKLSDKP
jgi:uncharacterized damage-inducible protein DinB